jgi:hypothetical protein
MSRRAKPHGACMAANSLKLRFARDDGKRIEMSDGLSRKQRDHDPFVCGIDYESDCPECQAARDADLLARWPHLSRPGPQPWNQIPGTLEECLALAKTPRPTPEQASQASLEELIEKIVRRVLVEELVPAVEYILSSRYGGHDEAA